MRLDIYSNTYDNFLADSKNKTCVLFGAGRNIEKIIQDIAQDGVKPAYIVDNDHKRWGQEIMGISIASSAQLRQENQCSVVVLNCIDDVFYVDRMLREWGVVHSYSYKLFFEHLLEKFPVLGLGFDFKNADFSQMEEDTRK